METVLLINKHVENVLEDQPKREDILNYLDEIKRLEVKNISLPFFVTEIRDNYEFNALRKLWRFIHTSKLEVDYDRVFIYEIPLVLYKWLKNHSFEQITDQLAYYHAYLSFLLPSEHKYKDVHHYFLNSVIDRTKEIHQIDLKTIDDEKFYREVIADIPVNSDAQKTALLKYIVSFHRKYGSLPIPPLIVEYGKRINDSEWSQIVDKYNFSVNIYGSFKYYFSLTDSRLHSTRSDDEYTDKHLDKWKYFYVNDFDLLDSIYSDVKVVSTSTKKTKYCWTCEICGRLAVFENKVQELHPTDEVLCPKCYYGEYFEIQKRS